MSTGIVTRRKSAMHIDNSYGVNVVAANTNLVGRRALKNEPFSTQIVCDEGYSIYEITIKMGGVDITSTAYDPTYNMITIPSVTGDVDIECYAMHSIPSDYIRVDGIKNPSNAYINTGYTLSFKNIVTIDSTLLGGGDGYIIGSKASSKPTVQGTVLRIYTGYSNLWYDPSIMGIMEMQGINTVGRNSVVFDHYNGKVYGNGALKKTYNKANKTDAAVACLFKCSPSDTQQSANMIINSCYIFDATTKVYERYYIPCLNASGVAGFWDAARGVFQGSSNSTAFVPIDTYDAQVEYLEGDGNAYIQTNYVPTGSGVKFEGKLYLIRYGISWQAWFGSYVNEDTDCYRICRKSGDSTLALYNNGSKANSAGTVSIPSLNAMYTFELTAGQLIINGSTNTYTGTTGNTNTDKLKIFKLGAQSSAIRGRYYYFKVYNNDQLVLDFIPVRKNGVGYFYDKVSQRLYGNANSSGAFTYGNDVSQ